MAKLRKNLFVIAKLSFAVGLVVWLVQTGRLDLSSASILLEDTKLLLACAMMWLISAIICNSMRWHLLVSAIGIRLSRWRAIQISMVGLAFNTFLPGSVGGDLIKALYLYRNHPGGEKTPALLTIILDRILGLCALFLLALPLILWQWASLTSNPLLLSLCVTTVCIAMGMVLFIAGVFVPWKDGRDPFARLFALKIVGFSFLEKIYRALRFYRQKPGTILKALGVSTLSQLAVLSGVGLIADRMIGSGELDILRYAAIMPLGILATAIPLAPGGLGVGHVAFGTLFSIIGIDQGANIYNVFFVMVTVPNLLGLVQYMVLKNQRLAYADAVEPRSGGTLGA